MAGPDVATRRLPWDAADPYPFYAARRRDGDVVWDAGVDAWLVLGFHTARDVLAGPHWTSDPRANRAVAGAPRPLGSVFVEANMLFTDPPTHDRLRGAVRDVFCRSFIERLDDGVESICGDTVSTIPNGQTFDAMTQIALPLPIAVIGAWLGLDTDQCVALREHSPAIIRILGGFAGRDEFEDGLAAAAALVADVLPAVADRRSQPRDDLLTFLAADPALSLDEAVVTAILLAIAGHETTANLLGASLIRLLTPAADGSRVADRIEEPDPAVITELLRLDAPVQVVARTATANRSVAGVDIGCGETVLVCIAAANRDLAVFDVPNEFRPDRRGPAPLTFGHGAHYCLGAALARLEIAAALRHILARRPVLAGPPVWRDNPVIRGPLSVPMRFMA